MKSHGGLHLSFQVRILDDAGLQELGKRVSKALGCIFLPCRHREFEGEAALETTLLGLWITLAFIPPTLENHEGRYCLRGLIEEELLDSGKFDGNRIRISEFILGVLHYRDSPQWYIPTIQEHRDDAGLDSQETS